VLAQPDSLELLVVGDGVTDATRKVLAEFDDPRLVVHDLPKAPGYGYTSRRTVLAGARGRWVAFAADDDLWAPDHLAVLGAVLGSGADLAHTRAAWVTPDGGFTVIPFRIDDPRNAERFGTMNSAVVPGASGLARPVPATCWAATRDAIERVGGWPTDVTESADWQLWKAIAATGSLASSRRVTSLHFRSPRRRHDHVGVDWERALLATAGFEPPRLGDAVPVLADSLAGPAADPAWWTRLSEIADLQVDWDACAVVEVANFRERVLESARERVTRLEADIAGLTGALVREGRAARASASRVAQLEAEVVVLRGSASRVAQLEAEVVVLRGSASRVAQLEAEVVVLRGSASRVAQLESEVAVLRGSASRVPQLEAEIARLLGSTSWRATAPLRAVRRWLGRGREGGASRDPRPTAPAA
jgi:hypothetical protein